MKATVIIVLCLYGVVVATKGVVQISNISQHFHNREKRQARWGSQGGSSLMNWFLRNMQNQQTAQQGWPAPTQSAAVQFNGMPTPTWAPTTMGTQANFGSQNWGSTQPSVGFPSMFNDSPRSRNSLQAPPTSGTSRGSKSPAKKQSSKSQKTRGSAKKSPPAQGGPPPGRGPPTRPAPTQPLPTYPPTVPPRSMRRSKSRRNRPRPQGRSMAPKSNFKMASMIPPSFLQGLGRAMADKLRTMWLNPLYQQQAKAAGDNFVVNPNPVNIGYHACPPTIMSHRCVYNPCPRCRNQAIECWTNPCGGCTGEMYLRGTKIHDCETI